MNESAQNGDCRPDEPPLRLHLNTRTVTRCQADDDDECDYDRCPQLRDGEPAKSGRHCPLDVCDDE